MYEIIITLTILTTLYLIPIRYAYFYIQYSYYHVDGRWYGGKPDYTAFYIIFMPIINLFASVDYFTGDWRNRELRTKEKELTFFKPKKKL